MNNRIKIKNYFSDLQFITSTYLLLFSFLCCITKANSQDLRYEKIDSLSTQFSEYQTAANGGTYNDGQKIIEVRFPGDNFKLWVSDRLATMAIIKKESNREVLAITNDIDLSLVDSIQWLNTWKMENDKFMFVFRLYFPYNSLNTQLYENGEYSKTIRESYLDFFIGFKQVEVAPSSIPWGRFITDFIDLIYQLKKEKNWTEPFSLVKHRKDWENAIDNKSGKKESEDIWSFMQNYNTSMLRPFARKLYYVVKDIENAEEKKLLVNQKYINQLAQEYKFKKGQNLSAFLQYNPEGKKLMDGNRYASAESVTYMSKMKLKNYLGNPFSEGGHYVVINGRTNIIEEYNHMVLADKWPEVLVSVSAFVSEIKNNISPEYIKEKANSVLYVEVPGAEAFITINTHKMNNNAAWSITFKSPK